MIDIIDDMVRMAKEVKAFGGRVYRSYPQLKDRMKAFAVIERGARAVAQSDDEGQEVVVDLTYTVTVLDATPEAVDDRVAELTSIYNGLHIQNTGSVRGFQTSNGMYTSQVTYSCRVDKRGCTYAR